jgi:hypothetical protein
MSEDWPGYKVEYAPKIFHIRNDGNLIRGAGTMFLLRCGNDLSLCGFYTGNHDLPVCFGCNYGIECFVVEIGHAVEIHGTTSLLNIAGFRTIRNTAGWERYDSLCRSFRRSGTPELGQKGVDKNINSYLVPTKHSSRNQQLEKGYTVESSLI